ncbi:MULTISPECIES: hypothetical protein [unclassified Streptomyces]|uniref:hypothetical protein n=1 Tax=unclassified Streptomyces TaxID=2593676 RepID=UPI003800E632
MHHVRRSAAMTLLLLLAVTFGPMLCRIGGDQAWLAGRAAATAAAEPTASASDGPPRAAAAPLAVAEAPKKCSGRHAPGPGESVPVPTPHRGELLAPADTGPAPLATHLAGRFALARPPTGGAPATDHTALLPVLRI